MGPFEIAREVSPHKAKQQGWQWFSKREVFSGVLLSMGPARSSGPWRAFRLEQIINKIGLDREALGGGTQCKK